MISISDFLPTETWIDFNRGIIDWLTTPRLVILPLSILVLLFWAIPFTWTRKWLSKLAAAMLLSYLLISSPPAAALAVKGLTFWLPTDTEAVADTIVVLHRGSDMAASRSDIAAQLWQSRQAQRIFVTSREEAIAIRERIGESSLSAGVIDGIRCALTTYEEATFAAAILGPQDIRQIILVTDPLHMGRAMLMFRSVGLKVFPQVSTLPSDWPSVQIAWASFREYLGLVSYWLLGRFRPQPAETLDHPPTEILEELATRRCKISEFVREGTARGAARL